MKKCKYCDTENRNDAKVCAACNGNEFSYKCSNCGTVFDSGYCPNCGAKAGDDGKQCPRCNKRYFSSACPACGYSPVEKRDVPAATVINNVYTKEPEKKKVTFGTVLLWIFFLPIMALIAIWKSKNIKPVWKIILTIILLSLLTYSYATNGNTTGKTSKSDLPKATASVEMKTSEPQKKSSKDAKATTEPAITPTPTEESVFSVEYSDGQYKVGNDMKPGEYVAIATDSYGGYICVSKDSNNDDIIFNDTFVTNTVFEVLDGEYLKLSGCVIVRADEFYANYTVTPDKDGVMLKVGHDIDAGEYKLKATSGSGYYCIYNDTRHSDIVSNDVFNTTSYVTVKNGQYLILNRCTLTDK